MKKKLSVEKLLASRKSLPKIEVSPAARDEAAEGGCGVIGIACSEKLPGRHLLQSLIQMRNRGNSKGGGIAAVGLVPEEFGVSQKVMEEDYLIAVAYLEPAVREKVEKTSIYPTFDVDHIREQAHIKDFTTLGLDVPPPEVVYYFVRLKPEVADAFRSEHNMGDAPQRKVEDEIVFQNTYKLNTQFYASTGETRAFVLSHGKNLLVLKMVGYGDDVVKYYQLEDMHAHVWIGHHRYPTKGRVWHPGGAHPFVGLNEALVHNGDFANYASISEYLAQRNIYSLFLTDTEVSVQVFDLLHRVYEYPLEYVIESLAPTTERDFTKLPDDKKRLYRMLQSTHMHSSPDGPWFFLIAQSAPAEMKSEAYRLIGITDTSMLRPQVFALQEVGGDGPSIGFAASEKQAIDAALESLASEDNRFWPRADRYWNARGGSHTDGGAFIFSVDSNGNGGSARMVCTDKFGREVGIDSSNPPYRNNGSPATMESEAVTLPVLNALELFDWFKKQIPAWDYAEFENFLAALVQDANSDTGRKRSIQVLTHLIDRRYPSGNMRRSSLVALCDEALGQIFEGIKESPSEAYEFVSPDRPLPEPAQPDQSAVIDARGYKPEGEHSVAMLLVELHKRGFCNFIVANARGHRFIGNGFGANSSGIRIDVYGSPGDYLASGLDGMAIHVHGNAQDQLCQIMKSGKLVVHGDVGQTFGYAAKGGEAYILGNAAGRPMINAVGKPRVIINGTCLDYLAESFMAGDPHHDGGFVILNGIRVTDQGEIIDLDEPYPGGNLFSLASGGCIYIRDPQGKVGEDQLNGGEFAPLEERDWELIKPYLEENQRQFGISIDALLKGEEPANVYRKIQPHAVRALQAEESWVRH